jgi:hypothetical protein
MAETVVIVTEACILWWCIGLEFARSMQVSIFANAISVLIGLLLTASVGTC